MVKTNEKKRANNRERKRWSVKAKRATYNRRGKGEVINHLNAKSRNGKPKKLSKMHIEAGRDSAINPRSIRAIVNAKRLSQIKRQYIIGTRKLL